MRTRPRLRNWQVTLAALLLVLAATSTAQSGVYRTYYYDVYYTDSTQYSWAQSLTAYLNRAFTAAKTVVGYDSRRGNPSIYFYNANDGAAGYMYGGLQNIYLNRYYFRSYEYWGSVVAHETAHVLFFNFTNATYWNYNLRYYTTFLTEALSWYAGDYVYNAAKYSYNRNTVYSEIRSNLRYYAARTGYILSWYGAGYLYTNYPGGYLGAQTIWQLRAIGYFLTGGLLTSSSQNLMKTLWAFRVFSQNPSYGVRSSNFNIARNHFEAAFMYGYGRYANAGWYYGSYNNTNYLYGLFYYAFY